MLIAAFPAGPWGTNCYVVAAAVGEECVIVDPGMGAADGIADIVRQHRLRPAAVLLTHGHLDHTWAVAPVCGAYETAAYLHPADRHMLTDPLATMSGDTAAMLAGMDLPLAEPDDLRELTDAMRLDVAGLEFTIDHAPGHTAGSVMFTTEYDEHDVPAVVFSGDVLFAGSIGRTDLPTGDHAAMLRSLETKILPLDDAIVVLPGHGEQTTIGRERHTNPFLTDLPINEPGTR